jgi:hypothetical protein
VQVQPLKEAALAKLRAERAVIDGYVFREE